MSKPILGAGSSRTAAARLEAGHLFVKTREFGQPSHVVQPRGYYISYDVYGFLASTATEATQLQERVLAGEAIDTDHPSANFIAEASHPLARASIGEIVVVEAFQRQTI